MGLTELESRCLKSYGPSGSTGENISVLLPASRGCLQALARSPVFYLQSQQCSIFRSVSLLLPPHLLL